MNHEFSVNEMDENGHIPVSGDKAADIVGATIKFHFNDGNLECKYLKIKEDAHEQFLKGEGE